VSGKYHHDSNAARLNFPAFCRCTHICTAR
jgi:hypothetical protein